MLNSPNPYYPEGSPWATKPDKEIWHCFQQGSWPALEYIYRRYTQDLFNYGMKICLNSSLVEDATQDLFVELWNTRKKLAPVDKIKTYLLKALKWKIHHYITREKKLYGNQRIEHAPNVAIVFSFENQLLAEQVTEERKAFLTTAVQNLPQRQREVLQLLFFENLSPAEVAEIMHIRVQSVYVTASRALATLRQVLGHPLAKKLFQWILLWGVAAVC